MTKLEKWVIAQIKVKLDEYKGSDVRGGSIASKLFEIEIRSDSYACCAYDAKQWIKKHFEELTEVAENYEDELCNAPVNCLEEPEVFQVQIIVYLATCVLEKLPFVVENRCDEITLTSANIKRIKREIKELYA